jgi:tetratricopeptide (TPR) repeat protein
MVKNSTSVQAFTIREALNLCEIAEYERAGSLLPSPDLDSSDPELLFAWGVVLSGQSQQELAKDLLSKGSRLLDKEPAELARIYLALCYWRLGEISEALVLLGIEPEGTEAQFCCLLVRAIIETEQGNSHTALALLARVNLADLSDAKCGKFHNHRGLALRKLGKLDEAIQEFERAINYWKDAPELLALAKNNVARA